MCACFKTFILFFLSFFHLIIFFSHSAEAAEWSAKPSMQLGREHNNNPQLAVSSHSSVTGSMVAPRLDLAVSSDIWQLRSGIEAVQKRYSGIGDIDRDDRFYDLSASYKTERSTWQLAASSSKNSTLADERIRTDTGLVQTQKIYDTHSISPSWMWALNELTQLQFVYSYENTSYVNGQSASLNDYSTRSISTKLTRQTDPQGQIFISTGYSIFNVPASFSAPITAFESKSAVYQFGVIRSYSESTQMTLTVGNRKTSEERLVSVCVSPFGPFCFKYANTSLFSKESSSVFSGSLEKQYQTTQLKINFSRAFDPSGLGGQVQTDSQTVMLSEQISARLTGNFSAGNYNYKSESSSLTGVDRHLYLAQPGLSWMWTRDLNVDLSYQYIHIKRGQEDKPAFSQAAYLTLRYGSPKLFFSR